MISPIRAVQVIASLASLGGCSTQFLDGDASLYIPSGAPAENEGDAFAAFASGALLGRAARVEDIVPTAVFLASADSDFITGQVMAIDGGMVLV